MSPPVIVGVFAGAFLLGSIPTGLLVARARHVDIRRVGSGNIGATNVGRALGRSWGLLVLAADAGKGFGPVLFARQALAAPPAVVAAIGLFAILGHMFTPFLRGRGGKGVATSLGVALGIAPLAGVVGFAIYLISYGVLHISSVGSLLGVASFPIVAWVSGLDRATVALGVAATVLVTLRHRENIRRLLRGEERRA